MRGGICDSPPQGALLSMALFRLDEQRHALPVTGVEQVLPTLAVAPLPQPPAIAPGVINLHGTVVPVVIGKNGAPR